ncbi:TIGR03943 family putative permease subunit [Streptomyces zingiberis]|uniref:TIGR03943 family protein n=1 Tax=Streptomyces zingiberis TaxID=2053010 RepID=A0ABX1BYT2_9ACTN|nr:TIGR03943 family protein [Streptomyces zingiberis]NJQ01646.1 TIGR03943 family protein [Streptomyces zingiberis]
MRRNVQVLLLVLTGAGLLHAALLTDVCLRFVKEGLRPALVASGALLVLLGLVAAARDGFPTARRDRADRRSSAPGAHGHGRAPGVAWLLFFPALSLLFFTPPALGAYTAAREAPPPATEAARAFPPLPGGSPLPMTLSEFRLRAGQDRARSLEGRTVRLLGFVTPAGDGGWYLSRLVVSCCAADSRAVKIRVYGAPAPPADTWVTVTGRLRPGPVPAAEAALDAERVRVAPEPADPYRDAAPPAGD